MGRRLFTRFTSNYCEKLANVSGFDILMHSNDYLERIGSSKFCLALPGDGWSGGLSVYIRNGCVPVIVQDGVDMPWEGTFLDYSKFSDSRS